MKENVYFLFGGSRENKRAERLVKHWESNGKNGMFLVTGYPNDKDGEVESMISYLIDGGISRESIWITASYDTLSNVESCIDVMRNCDNIYASTGPLHWLRFRLIFWLYYPEIREKISYFPSGEKEIWYAVVVLAVYFGLTPKVWREITRFIRKEQYNLCQNPENILAIAEKFGVKCLIGQITYKQVGHFFQLAFCLLGKNIVVCSDKREKIKVKMGLNKKSLQKFDKNKIIVYNMLSKIIFYSIIC